MNHTKDNIKGISNGVPFFIICRKVGHMASIPEYAKPYLNHPMLVKHDEYGFPMLEIGKFYMMVYSSFRNSSYVRGIWKCSSKMKHVKEVHLAHHHATSCMMLHLDVGKSGVSGFLGHYIWFGNGNNIIIELLPEQQEAYSTFEHMLNQAKSDCEYRWDLNAVDCKV